MKALKDISEGTYVQLENSILEYYIRGEAKNGRVHMKCYTTNHERYAHRDCSLKKETKVKLYKP